MRYGFQDKPIKFGTDGWRGIISFDLTADNLVRITQGIANYLFSEERKNLEPYKWRKENYTYKLEYRPPEAGVVIGYDARFLSERYAELVGEVLSELGIDVTISDRMTTTPATSFLVVHKKAAAGIMITASHNPPEYNGVKIKAEYGGSALPEMTALIEKMINRPPKEIGRKGEIRRENFEEPYLKAVSKKVDLERIAHFLTTNGITVIVDYMYGSAVGQFKKLFKDLPKVERHIIELHTERNPLFGGNPPEPIPRNLVDLEREVKARNAVGFAFDGDADRIAGYTPSGFLTPHDILALLVWYLGKYKGLDGKVVRTVSTSTKAARIARLLDLETVETPVGFKHICRLFITDNVLVGGEESGGIGIKGHIPERDSLLNSLLLLEFMAVTGKTLDQLLDELYEQIGYTHTRRIDIRFEDEEARERAFEKFLNSIPAEILDLKVRNVDRKDGVKLELSDGSWILVRKSGTEPLIRLYAEAPSIELLEKLLAEGKRLMGVS